MGKNEKKNEKRKKLKSILSFPLSSSTRLVNLPLNLLITAVYKPRGQLPLLSLGSYTQGSQLEVVLHSGLTGKPVDVSLLLAHTVHICQGLTQMSLLIWVL